VDTKEIDISGNIVKTCEEIEAKVACLPKLEKLIMSDCGIDNETMAAFRERQRPNYKVVWTVYLSNKTKARTDDIYFMPIQQGEYYFLDKHSYNLRYCEDMLCVDLGHHNIVDLSFVEGMPHLKYFICVDSNLMYIEPISTCKELIYCELFWTKISDFTPLLGCTSLEDLNVAGTNGDPMVFKDMPWLKNLWIRGSAVRPSEWETLKAALPDTNIVFDTGGYTTNGWRQLQNYYDMRDLLGMPYNTW